MTPKLKSIQSDFENSESALKDIREKLEWLKYKDLEPIPGMISDIDTVIAKMYMYINTNKDYDKALKMLKMGDQK